MILGNLLIVSDHLSTWLVCSNLWTFLFTEEIDPLSTNCLKDNSETLTAVHSYCQNNTNSQKFPFQQLRKISCECENGKLLDQPLEVVTWAKPAS